MLGSDLNIWWEMVCVEQVYGNHIRYRRRACGRHQCLEIACIGNTVHGTIRTNEWSGTERQMTSNVAQGTNCNIDKPHLPHQPR